MEDNSTEIKVSGDSISILEKVEQKYKEKTSKLPQVVQQFIALGRSIKLDDDKFYTWEDMMSSKAVSLNKLRTRLISINQIINALEPEYNSEIHFTCTLKDEIIHFTWEDTKNIIKTVIDLRMKTPEYLKAKAEYQKAMNAKPRNVRHIVKLSKSI